MTREKQYDKARDALSRDEYISYVTMLEWVESGIMLSWDRLDYLKRLEKKIVEHTNKK